MISVGGDDDDDYDERGGRDDAPVVGNGDDWGRREYKMMRG